MMTDKLTWTNDKRKLSELIPWEHNPRVIRKAEAERLAESWRQFGQPEVIAIGPGGEVYNGHQRLKVWAAEFGDVEVDVRVASRPLTERERQQLTAYLHAGAVGGWDWDALSAWDTDDLKGWGFDTDLLATWNDDAANLREMIEAAQEEPPADPGAQIDRAAELQEQWHTERGQLWEIPSNSVPGRCHRVLCGDSTSAEDVARLMGGEKAALFNTDPPYGIAYGEKGTQNWKGEQDRLKIASDSFHDEELQGFLEGVFKLWAEVALKENAAWYLWHAHLTQGFFAAAAAAAAANVILHRQIIWVKPSLILGMGQYHWRHEPCFFGWIQGHQPPDYNDRKDTTVWEVGKQKATDHPTEKPVELFERPIIKHTRPGEICAEPFSGSGSQIVAAERQGRRCYGMEIEPKYVAVTLERLAGLGLEPRLVE